MLRPHAGYHPGRVGDDGDDSLDITAMGAHVDRIGNIDATFLLGLRVHRLHGEENPHEDSDRAAESGDPDYLGPHRQSQTGIPFSPDRFLAVAENRTRRLYHGIN